MSFSNNSSFNLTNSTINQVPYDYLFQALITLDHISRYYNIVVHLVFIIFLKFSRKLHSRTMFYLNHMNITNSFYGLVLFFYTFGDRPTFPNESLNTILCQITEFFWSFAVYLRMYSLFLIAIYRYIAAFRIHWYKKLNDSILYLSIPVVVVWIVSISFPLIWKYAFSTVPGYRYCLDGYSTHLPNTIGYCIMNYVLMVVIPSGFIFWVYRQIINKLKKVNAKLETKKRARI